MSNVCADPPGLHEHRKQLALLRYRAMTEKGWNERRREKVVRHALEVAIEDRGLSAEKSAVKYNTLLHLRAFILSDGSV